MYCQNCGQSLSPNAVFCGDCGTPVLPEEPSRKEVKPRKKKERIPLKQELRKGWPLFLIIALCCLLRIFTPTTIWVFERSIPLFISGIITAVLAYGTAVYGLRFSSLLTLETILQLFFDWDQILSLIQIAICVFIVLLLKLCLRKTSKPLKTLFPSIAGGVLAPCVAPIFAFPSVLYILPTVIISLFSAGLIVGLYLWQNAKKESRKNVPLFFLPILCFLYHWIIELILPGVNYHTDWSTVCVLLCSASMGAISYTATRKKFYFTLLIALPRLVQANRGPIMYLYNPFAYGEAETIIYLISILQIILPITIILLLKKTLSKKIRSPQLQVLITSLIPGVCAEIAAGILRNKGVDSFGSAPFVQGGIILVTAALLCLLCEKRKTMTKNMTPLPPKPEEAMLCTVCKNPLQSNDLFCSECGTPVTSSRTSPQNTGDRENKPAHVCYNCGNPLQDTDLFCPECGTPSKKQTVPQVQEESPNHSDNPSEEKATAPSQWKNLAQKLHVSTKTLKIAGLVLAVILIVSLFAYFNSAAYLEKRLTSHKWYQRPEFTWYDGYYHKEGEILDFHSNGEVEITFYDVYSYSGVPEMKQRSESKDDWELVDGKTLHIDGEYYEYGDEWRFSNGKLIIGDATYEKYNNGNYPD